MRHARGEGVSSQTPTVPSPTRGGASPVASNQRYQPPVPWLRFVAAACFACACGSQDELHLRAPAVALRAPASAVLSVTGSGPSDVWLAGADDGLGPLLVHYDGDSLRRHSLATEGDLWWAHSLGASDILLGGADGQVLRYDHGQLTRLETPGLGRDIVFGVWAASERDVYAVGASRGRNGFAWHSEGGAFEALALPNDVPLDENQDFPGLFKVWGSSADDVWIVGQRGLVLRGNAREGFERVETPSEEPLLTVTGFASAEGSRVLFVGGQARGVVWEASGGAGVQALDLPDAGLLQGLAAGPDGAFWAVGLGGAVFRRASPQRPFEVIPQVEPVESFHAAWVGPQGALWAVGGRTLSGSLDDGLVVTTRAGVESLRIDPPRAVVPDTCPKEERDPAPGASVARRWNEQLLGAVRRDLPRPTVHARNLFHTSVAVWDAWAAYEPAAEGVVVTEKLDAPADLVAARREALSYAAYRVLSHRYRTAVGGAVSQACFDALMGALGYDPSDRRTKGSGARALGNRVGERVIEAFAEDGANEAADYADTTGFAPANPPLSVDLPGTQARSAELFQQLELSEAVTQNGIAEGSGVREYVGAHWGEVTPFALQRPEPGAPYWDLGTPPVRYDAELVEQAVGVLRAGRALDVSDGQRMDISPGAYGNNPLGSNAGEGHPQNPVTGRPYEPQRALRGDFTRVLAEFWADGPDSETPPGHWNALANAVSYDSRFERRLSGTGPELDPLSWDVHLYLALNGALHDAAIAAWELKRRYTSSRPITLIRYAGALGQRTDPLGLAYHPEGLPLVPGLVEVITQESSAPGERHSALGRYVGELALFSYRGEPGDRAREVGGVGWIRAKDWVPYQRRFFVTPAFPGYVSGHSTFSRAAAEVLTALTGNAYFPGGLGSYRFEPGYLAFEAGPSEPLELQWATYFDASDQAGQSRLYGGIHVVVDDFDGRRLGAAVAAQALPVARRYFGKR